MITTTPPAMSSPGDTHGGTDALCAFVASTRWDDIPSRVRHEAKRSLLNYFAVALAGCRDPAVEQMRQVMAPFNGLATASLIGRAERTDLLQAAALNAMAANVFDFDDTHVPTIIHPTGPVAAPLFALAQQATTTGSELLLAFVLGVEVECRIGNAMSPGHYQRGWHITSTCGVFGSAAAVAHRFGLAADGVRLALGCASAQAGGLVETLGTFSKSVSVGNAARNGLVSALLARRGYSGPADPLAGERGYLRVACDAARPAELSDGLGQDWQLLRNTYKPYPCGVVLNPVIEATLALAARQPIVVTDIDRIDISGHPLLRQRTDRPDVRTGRLSQVSAQHAVAAALVRQRAGLAEFSDDAVADPVLRAVGATVRVLEDASFGVDAARIRITMKDGSVHEHTVELAAGGLDRPMSDHDIELKLRTLARDASSGCDVDRLIDAVWRLDRLDDAAAPMTLAAVGARS